MENQDTNAAETVATTDGATPEVKIEVTDNQVSKADYNLAISERDSAAKRIAELNKENEKYRILNNSVKEMGLTPDEIKSKLEALANYEKFGDTEAIQSKLTELDNLVETGRKVNQEKLAEDSGYNKLLGGFALKNDFVLKSVEVEVKGKKVNQLVAVTTDGETPTETPIDEFLKTNYEDYIPALKTVINSNGVAYAPQAHEENSDANVSESMKKGLLASNRATRSAL